MKNDRFGVGNKGRRNNLRRKRDNPGLLHSACVLTRLITVAEELERTRKRRNNLWVVRMDR